MVNTGAPNLETLSGRVHSGAGKGHPWNLGATSSQLQVESGEISFAANRKLPESQRLA